MITPGKLNRWLYEYEVKMRQINIFLYFSSAIRRFTSAIRIDPTYVRAYVCRAEAYSYESLVC